MKHRGGRPSGRADPSVSRRQKTLKTLHRLRHLLALGGIGLLTGCQLPAVSGQPPGGGASYPTQPTTDVLTGPVPVARVIDGDTVWVKTEGGDSKIRLIGVDTPELVDPRSPVECFAREASDYTKSTLTGQLVYLENDPTQDSIDRYGRRLAYVWTLDGRLLNFDLINEGYATEYTYGTPYRYQQQFRDAEAAAAAQERGLWSPKTCAAQR